MSTFTSKEYCDISQNGLEGYYTHDRGTKTIILKDGLLNNQASLDARAKAELVNSGYAKRYITLKTIHIPNLKQNDVISYGGFKWIVREISLDVNPPSVVQTIKGLRYE